MTGRITAEEVAEALRRAREAIDIKAGDPLYPIQVANETAVLHFGYERTWLHEENTKLVELLRLAIVGAQAVADTRVDGNREGIRLEVAKQATSLAKSLETSTAKAVKATLPWISPWALAIFAALVIAAGVGGRYSGVREVQAIAQQNGSALVVGAQQSGSAGLATWTGLTQLNPDPAGAIALCPKTGGIQRDPEGRLWCAVPLYIPGTAGPAKP